MSAPAAKRRRIDAASTTLSKPFRSPLKTPFKSPLKQPSDIIKPSTSTPLRDTPILAEKTPTLCLPTTTPNRASRSKKTFSSPVAATQLNGDPDIAPLLRTQRELEKTLRELKEGLETAEQASKIEKDSAKREDGEIDGELFELIEKWKGASRLAAEELFGKVRERVNRMGGPRAWKQMQKRQQEFQGQWDQEQTGNNDGEEEDEEGKKAEKRDIYAEYGIGPETENERSQREKVFGDTGELPGEEDAGVYNGSDAQNS